MKLTKSFLTAACLCLSGLAVASHQDYRETSLLLKPAYELTNKDRVLLDILHHDHMLSLNEDFSSIQEINGRYPEAFEKAFEQYNSLGKSISGREKHARLVAKAAEYLATLVTSERSSGKDKIIEKAALRASSSPMIALTIGIDYRHTSHQLQNCINDTEHVMEQILIPRLGMHKEDMIIMNDYQYGTPYYPTKNNILSQMQNFVAGLNQVKQGYFHYSGHGSTTYDQNGDEKDGQDEVMIPIDYDHAGGILDDQIFNTLIRGLAPDVKLTVTMDCCHSGTILDLPYKWRYDGTYTMENNFSSKELQSLPNVVMLSGCMDYQTSADGGTFSGATKGAGAMTGAYIETLKEYNYHLTYKQLLIGVNYILAKGGYSQRAELTSTYPLNLDDYYMVQKTSLRP